MTQVLDGCAAACRSLETQVLAHDNDVDGLQAPTPSPAGRGAGARAHARSAVRRYAGARVLERPGVGAPLEDQGQLPWSWLYDYGAAASW